MFVSGFSGYGEDFWNEMLVELSRLVRRGGRIALTHHDDTASSYSSKQRTQILTVAEGALSRYWTREGEFQCGVGGISENSVSKNPNKMTVTVLRRA